MGNQPTAWYDYSRAGVAMVTLNTRPGIWLCSIRDTFKLYKVGRIVQEQMQQIPKHYSQVKIGQYQIMPDHLHLLVHVTRALPAGITLHRVIRGYKAGVNKTCQEKLGDDFEHVFKPGMHDRLVFNRDHLEREVRYIRDNVRRYRMLRDNPDMFRKPRFINIADMVKVWCFGNSFLLDHPLRLQVQISRRATEAQWREIREHLERALEQGAVIVSPFISPLEQVVFNEVVQCGGRAIRITHDFFGERYKPSGQRFDMCCEGRLLELSVAREFERYAELSRVACLRMNEVAEAVATGLLCPGDWA